MRDFLSIPRVMVIAGHTFTQLVRMKVFYFLVVFALIVLGIQFVDMSMLGAVSAVEQNLRVMKGAGFFAMNTFSVILALSATALLLPKDIEDRTLYTILCKPVQRLDYLLGKLMGVMLLVGVGLLVMDGLFCLILNSRVESIVSAQSEALQKMGRSEVYIAESVEAIRAQGVSWGMQAGVLAVFLKALVVASIALLVSTFSTSTLFTIVITVVVVVIGLIQGEARDYFLEQQSLGKSSGMLEMTRWVALLFPDFKLLGIEDGVINGRDVPLRLLWQVSLVAVLYSAIYTCLSWFVFRRKEL
ncbi:ABC transporter permease subunit [Rubritalea tangerina]|uniref:ABC transporter permease subunit n=2 Tax=Rubritalea tangerina TaxID=430798 RepID=A0ABW4Z7F4_9BACT